MASVLEQIRKLDEQKASLLQNAKQEAIAKAEAAISELNELGFHYRLVESGTPSLAVRAGIATSSSKRRTGIRDDVLRVVGEHGEGVSRAKVLELMGAKGDKSSEQSISNALAALKKGGQVTLKDGLYKAA